MRYRLISCEVFTREACLAIADSPNTIDPEFTPKGSHNEPDKLRADIQARIDSADNSKDFKYDAILLGFGLCGNSIAGLKAGKLPIIIPRAHDCCTIFLGSIKNFKNDFSDNLSSSWSSEGYFERGGTLKGSGTAADVAWLSQGYRDIVEKYGEENAAYIWEMLHPNEKKEHIFITTPELRNLKIFEKFKCTISDGMEPKLLEGNMRLLRLLMNTNWLEVESDGKRQNQDEFLYVEPGRQICALYDMEDIFDAR